jgi:hypothetical protein
VNLIPLIYRVNIYGTDDFSVAAEEAFDEVPPNDLSGTA